MDTTFKKPASKRKTPPKKKPKTPTDRTSKAMDIVSGDTTSVTPDPGVKPPTVTKKKKVEGAFTGTVTPIVPRRTTFEIAAREGTPEVHLLPYVVAKGGKITGISFGRNRTPSPFGSKMGDHTASWASVVDTVHARLYGKTLEGAVTELETMQNDAQEWMSKPASVGMKLWNQLDTADQDKRREVLENYAYTVGQRITKAKELLAAASTGPVALAAANEQVPDLLAQATAHHLAFLNFLPFATVPAKGAVSKGSGEGVARAKVLDIELDAEDAREWAEFLRTEKPEDKVAREKADADAEKLLTDKESPEQTRKRHEAAAQAALDARRKQLSNGLDGLWGLFSMDAAVRVANLDPIVAPKRIDGHVKQLKQLQTLANTVKAVLPGFVLDPAPEPEPGQKRQKRRSTEPKRASGTDQFIIDVTTWLKTAVALQQAEDLPYPEVKPLATELVNAITGMQSITGKVLAKQSDAFESNLTKITGMVADLGKLIDRLSTDPAKGLEDSARLLAHLVHDHQSNMGRAYPDAVEQTRFLGETPDDTAKVKAVERIVALVTDPLKGIKGVETAALKTLTDKILAVYPTVGDTPAVGPKTRWVADSANASLIATFKGADVSVQGRPAAPPGVGGMGSHTTAWVTEVGYVKKRLAKALKKEALVEALQGDALDELAGNLMTGLAHHLPAEQLAGGQLGIIFDAAVNLLSATEAADAVTAYLSFRNLLPYATVDAGNRGGQAEREGASMNTLFDGKSLTAAIGQKLEELSPDRMETTAKALEDAAAALKKDYDATAEPADVDMTATVTEEPELTWKSNPTVKAAIEAAIKALGAEATRLRSAKATGTDATMGLEKHIYDTRYAEHVRVYKYAKS